MVKKTYELPDPNRVYPKAPPKKDRVKGCHYVTKKGNVRTWIGKRFRNIDRMRERMRVFCQKPSQKQKVRNYRKQVYVKEARRKRSAQYRAKPGVKEAMRKRYVIYYAKPSVRKATKERQAVYRAQPYNKQKFREDRIMRKYGLSPHAYVQMFEAQNYKCAICTSDVKPYTGSASHVDHRHSDSKVRSILCAKCNLGLKYIENEAFRKRALHYLIKHEMPQSVPAETITNEEWLDQCKEEWPRKKLMETIYRLRSDYGITIGHLLALQEQQQYQCEMCTNMFEVKRTPYRYKCFVDHNHDTAAVRSLLCLQCNTGLARIEDQEFLKAALTYLDKHK